MTLGCWSRGLRRPFALSAIYALILVSVGFFAGFVLRALISRKRRAAAREEWLRRQDQKRYDDGMQPAHRVLFFRFLMKL